MYFGKLVELAPTGMIRYLMQLPAQLCLKPLRKMVEDDGIEPPTLCL